ncbi:MAG: DUF3429 domain-containing protein [Aliiglaciecola sp.]|uniref:DUF3429 domain-containing protein n=1 Tax=Aliiglaciecola sp. M165 TaxID=2593649 RepID=UPI00117FF7A1|nr:DUF3429 domain-containing protein [Aliiglaciecola sp. M165]TRY32477.1 DUF3429 domain-containing protein [Aliiglaciecola sp. M165]
MIHTHAKLLGYLGLIPFIVMPFWITWGTVSFFEGFSFFSQYSAIILSFLGGVIWLDAIRHEKPISQLYIAMLPSITAWLSISLLPALSGLIVLFFSYLLLILYEFKVMPMASWYRSLRIRLTTIAMGTHLMMMWLA